MEKLERSSKDLFFKMEIIPLMYYFNLFVISLINLFTLLFIIYKKVHWKIYWILGVLLCNLTIFLSITDGGVSKYFILNGPIYLTHFRYYPFSVKIVFPIAAIIFWCIYLTKRNKSI